MDLQPTFNTIWIATGLYFSLKLRTVTFDAIGNLLMPVLVYLFVMLALLIVGNLVINDRSDSWCPEECWQTFSARSERGFRPRKTSRSSHISGQFEAVCRTNDPFGT